MIFYKVAQQPKNEEDQTNLFRDTDFHKEIPYNEGKWIKWPLLYSTGLGEFYHKQGIEWQVKATRVANGNPHNRVPVHSQIKQ